MIRAAIILPGPSEALAQEGSQVGLLDDFGKEAIFFYIWHL